MKKTFYWILTTLFVLILVELAASTILIHKYRSDVENPISFQGEISRFSIVNLAHKAGVSAGIFQRQTTTHNYRRSVQPQPYIIADDYLGYKASPGRFVHKYHLKRDTQSDWEYLDINVTINPDGTRWTGQGFHRNRPKIYLLGNSFVFGSGVSDEQTFAYHIQQALPETDVKLFALGGYSLIQSYLNFENLKDLIDHTDVIVLGYADFYDERHVVSPQYLKRVYKTNVRYGHEDQNEIFRPKIAIEEGAIKIEYVLTDCENNEGYCDQQEPDPEHLTEASASLINHIAQNTDASVILLHVDGDSSNPVLQNLNQDVQVVSALDRDFDYFIRDSVEDFDNHPGPYWHYSISRKIVPILSQHFDQAN